ncbi:hypothetical protein CRYUN_Cryun08bG0154400 [Craigia yunnanensis]
MVDTGDSTLTPKESHKNKERVDEKLETDNGGANHQQHKMDETDEIITEAEPLAWKPPAADQYQLLIRPAYKDGQCYGLPAGWQVEQRPRTSLKYIGKVDQYYYESGTNRQFRSLKAVRRHLQDTGQQHEQLPRPKQDHDEQATRQKDEHTLVVTQHGDDQLEASRSSSSHSRNKVKRKRKQASNYEFDFANTPEKVTWALTDAESDQWNPFIGEKVIPEAVKDLWVETFESIICQKNKAPKL